jgi:hypothetical protein
MVTVTVEPEAEVALTPPPAATVSVALCTFDGAPWLPAFLASLSRQRLLPDELVVQDDGSTDETLAILEAYCETAPFPVSVEVNPVRLGSTSNFERALERTSGAFVALADQDDIWYPEKLERLVGVLVEDPILTLTFSDADLIDPSGEPMGRRLWGQRRIRRVLVAQQIVAGSQFAQRALTTGCTMVGRRRAIDAALPFPDSLNDPVAPMRHDRWMSLVAAAVGTVRSMPEPLLGFRVHPGQQTGVLTTPERARRLAAAAVAAARPPTPEVRAAHLARAEQIDDAADRADRFGDFDEADALRRVAQHHRSRADLGRTVPQRLRTVWQQVASRSYDPSLMGAASASADLVRALRPGPDGSPR